MTKQTIYGNPPSKSNSYKIVKIRGVTTLAKTPALIKYENDFYIQCNHYRDKNIEGYFKFTADIFYSSQRLDLDNCAKIILDCLQRCKAIKNDNRCTELHLRKFLDKQNPRIEFSIEAV